MCYLSVCVCVFVLSHLLYLLAAWRGCHGRWGVFAHDGPPRLLLPEPRPDDGGPLCCCHGAQRLGHAPPWFHAQDHPPLIFQFSGFKFAFDFPENFCSKSFVIFLKNFEVANFEFIKCCLVGISRWYFFGWRF